MKKLTVVLFFLSIVLSQLLISQEITLEGYLELTDYNGARFIDKSGDYLYIGTGDDGDLVIVDVSNPADPTFVSSCTGYSWVPEVHGVDVVGNYVYACSSHPNGLTIFNVTDPSAPFLSGSAASTYSDLYKLVIFGDYAYCVEEIGDMHIFNISDPAAPALLSSYDTNAAISIAVRDNIAYTPKTGSYPGFSLTNVSDPSAPENIYGMSCWDSSIDVALIGEYAYVCAFNYDVRSHGIAIMDISNPNDPNEVEFFVTGMALKSIFASGSFLYFTDSNWAGIKIIDASNPTDLTLVGEYENDDLFGYEPAADAVVDDGFAYVVNGDYVIVLNCSDIVLDVEEEILLPQNITLSNYPNPFNPSTTISFEITNLHENARIEIYNLKGQKVKTFSHPELVEGSVSWNGKSENNQSVTSGMYFYKLSSGSQIVTKKMLMMK